MQYLGMTIKNIDYTACPDCLESTFMDEGRVQWCCGCGWNLSHNEKSMKNTYTPETDDAYVNAEVYDDQQWGAAGWEQSRKLELERNALREAIQKAVSSHSNIKWGYDGDGGSSAIMSELEDSLQSKNDTQQ